MDVYGILDRVYKLGRAFIASRIRTLSMHANAAIKRGVADEDRREKHKVVLRSIRRRRRPLPADAPDSVGVIRQIRGTNG